MAREINSFFEGIFQTRTSQTLKAAYLCKIDRKNATFVHLLKAQMFAQEPLFSYRSFSVSGFLIRLLRRRGVQRSSSIPTFYF